MENKVIRIPLDKSKFNDIKIKKGLSFLSDFFGNDFIVNIVTDIDDNSLCLEISKNK